MKRDIKQDGPGVHHCWSWVRGTKCSSFYFCMSPRAGESGERKRNCAISYKPKRWTFKFFYIFWSSLFSFFSSFPYSTSSFFFFLPREDQLHVYYFREVNRKASLAQATFWLRQGTDWTKLKAWQRQRTWVSISACLENSATSLQRHPMVKYKPESDDSIFVKDTEKDWDWKTFPGELNFITHECLTRAEWMETC